MIQVHFWAGFAIFIVNNLILVVTKVADSKMALDWSRAFGSANLNRWKQDWIAKDSWWTVKFITEKIILNDSLINFIIMFEFIKVKRNRYVQKSIRYNMTYVTYKWDM